MVTDADGDDDDDDDGLHTSIFLLLKNRLLKQKLLIQNKRNTW